ncbi:hypothetical protein QQY66_19795 [Streptomyces sp. DG2A-72]|uniref:hypothetical protein n=1 Tax=Streptomyces sp. DG2A-72 TaxID=3051386 RepID=UPI00265C1D1A|nr:hypothetical protein [Streptomyces sp. DG2A-72]MDO0933818.1 hypothetical protein [Streptomyces sp. DG2A-72]
MRCYWDEEDTWFYFEVNAEGWVTRQIELEGPELTPIAAACLGEYDSRFGITAELPVSEWEGHDPEQLTFQEFEEIWETARRQIARPVVMTPEVA